MTFGGGTSTSASAAASSSVGAFASGATSGAVAAGADGAGFAFETAGLRATAGFFPAGFRVAVLLVVLVGIIKDLFHGSCILSRASFLRFFFLRFLFSRNGIVNFLRFRFVHAKNIYKIL